MVEEQQRLGRYELLAEIGRGAMGVVYKARDPIIDRVLAIKTVDFRGLGAVQADVQNRFFQEAQSAGRLNHPNIVTIFDAGEADGCAYIAMELLEGASLREVLDQSAPLSVTRALELAGQIARGLAYAHEHGVVHRDVKPANIILVGRRVKITDFGIARLPYGPARARSELAGSPKYMSPEQVRSENVDGRSDLFALGTLLYEMLTGKQPFVGDSVPDIMQAVLLHEPPPPSSINPKVPASVDAFVLRVLSKRPEERPSSARSMLRELALLLRELGGGSSGRSSRSAERRRSQPARGMGDTTVLLPAAKRKKRERRSRTTPWGYGIAALLIAGLVGAYALRAPKEAAIAATTPQPAPVEAQVTVAALAELAPEAPVESAPAPVEIAPEPAPPVEAPKPAPKPVAKAKPKPKIAAAKTSAQPRAGGDATLQVAVAPWGEVFVNGRSHGTTPPLARIAVPPGKHRIEIRNGSLPAHRVDVTVAAGDTRRIQHKFE